MRIHRIYADAAGESHFEDVEIALGPEGPGGRLSERLPATWTAGDSYANSPASVYAVAVGP